MAGITEEFVNCLKRHICFSGVQARQQKNLSPSSAFGGAVMKALTATDSSVKCETWLCLYSKAKKKC